MLPDDAKYAFTCVTGKMAKEFVMAAASPKTRKREFSTLADKLADEEFDEDQHIKLVADRLNDDVLSEFQRERVEIQQLADRTSQQLKQNVYKNYTRWAEY